MNTTNNNLSNYDKNNVNSPTVADCNSPGVKEGSLDENSKNTPNTEGLTTATEGHLSTIFPNRAGSWNAQMAIYNGKNPGVFLRGADTTWEKWLALATKSDLTGIDAALSIREENGGVIVSFSSKDSKYGIYIGVSPNGVNVNYKLNGEWKKAIIIATQS